MERRVATLHDLQKVLKAEHRHLWELVAAVRRATRADRQDHLDRLLRYLAVHEAAEQTALHTAHVNDLTRERVDEEHEAAEIVDRLVRAVEASGVDSPEVDVLIEQLERTLRAHAAAEDEEELVVLAELLGPEALGEIHRALLMIREIAHDAASPVASGPFAAMMLAARREFSAVTAQVR